MTRRLAALLCLLAYALTLGPAPAGAQLSGFTEAVVPGLGQVPQPTAFAFLPGGRLLITTKPGRLLLYEGGALRAAPVFDKSADVCDNSERGMLGVAVDPAFADNGRVYVYYTFDKHNTKQDGDPGNDCDTNSAVDPVNRVSRLTLTSGLSVADETVLVDDIPSPNGNHNAGDLQFGKDGLLYISTGDGGRNDTARQRYNLDGAILRITGDGEIPVGNPYTGAGTARCYDPAPGGNQSGAVASNLICQELFAYGLRNPFRLAFDPSAATTRFLVNDVGQNNAEEISEAAPGADFGWNCYEGTRLNKSDGACSPLPQGTVQPYFEYHRNPALPGQQTFFNGCASITGGALVPDGLWPAAYDGAYIFADIVCARLFALQAGAGGPAPSLFLSGRGATHLAFGPLGAGQALYFADYSGGAIRYLQYTGADNRSPVAAFAAAPTSGDAPLTVSFDGGASADADSGDGVAAYLWSFGDGATAETAAPTVSHTYAGQGAFTASLRVRDGRGAESFRPATTRVTVGQAPPEPEPQPEPQPQPPSGDTALYLPFIATAGTPPPVVPPADAVSARLRVPAGFAVRGFAAGLSGPRLLALGPDGQLYVAERGANRIVRLPDRNRDGLAEPAEPVATGLGGVHSLEWRGDELYAALNDRVLRLSDQNGDGDLADQGEQTAVVSGLPVGGHSTRTARFGPDGKLYVAVGSSCNICVESDPRRAAILRYNPDGSIPDDNPYVNDTDQRRRAVWAEGLRNSVDFLFTVDGRLWATHNGSDNLGDDRPPEEIVIEVGKGAHYGWPYCYTAELGAVPAGAKEVRDTRVPLDARVPGCDAVVPALFTDLAHSAPLGAARHSGAGAPAGYADDLLVAYHGSWNSGSPRDCKLQRVVVEGGAPVSAEPFLTGFRDSPAQNCGGAWGRPAGVAISAAGEIFVTDDQNGNVYRVVHVGI